MMEEIFPNEILLHIFSFCGFAELSVYNKLLQNKDKRISLLKIKHNQRLALESVKFGYLLHILKAMRRNLLSLSICEEASFHGQIWLKEENFIHIVNCSKDVKTLLWFVNNAYYYDKGIYHEASRYDNIEILGYVEKFIPVPQEEILITCVFIKTFLKVLSWLISRNVL